MIGWISSIVCGIWCVSLDYLCVGLGGFRDGPRELREVVLDVT